MPPESSPTGRFAADQRGVSEVVGYVLVISLVISTIGIVSVSGISVLQDARSAEQTQTATRAFDLLAENVADVYRQGAPSRSTEVNLGGSQLVAEETTTLNVSGELANGTPFSTGPINVTTIRYEGSSDGQLIYDSGAIFRTSSPGGPGVAFRDSPFVIREDYTIITIPRTTADATSSVSGSTVLVRANRVDERVLLQNTSGGYENLTLTVSAPHWQAWNESLNERENVVCSHTGGDEIECDLLSGNAPDRVYVTVTDIRVELVR